MPENNKAPISPDLLMFLMVAGTVGLLLAVYIFITAAMRYN